MAFESAWNAFVLLSWQFNEDERQNEPVRVGPPRGRLSGMLPMAQKTDHARGVFSMAFDCVGTAPLKVRFIAQKQTPFGVRFLWRLTALELPRLGSVL